MLILPTLMDYLRLFIRGPQKTIVDKRPCSVEHEEARVSYRAFRRLTRNHKRWDMMELVIGEHDCGSTIGYPAWKRDVPRPLRCDRGQFLGECQ